MNTKQKMRLLLLATMTGISGQIVAMKGAVEGKTFEVKAPEKSTSKILTPSQKAQQAALPFWQRMASKTGETLGLESRGVMVEGKTNKVDLAATQRSLDMNPTTNYQGQGRVVENNAVINKTNADRTWTGGAKDKLANTGFALGLAKTRQISTRVKDMSGKETGEIRIDNVDAAGKLIDSTIYSADKASFMKLNPEGKILEQLTPDGRRIINTYEGGKLKTQREITANTLNFSSNKSSEITTFNADGTPKFATIETGNALNRARFTKDFTNPENPKEYTLKDNKGNPLETRTASEKDPNLYEIKDANGKLLKSEKVDNNGQLQELNIFDKSGQPVTTISMKDGLPTTVIRDSQGNQLSSVTMNADGTATVVSAVPETWSLSGGLLGTGRTKTTTSIVENGVVTNRDVNIQRPGNKAAQATDGVELTPVTVEQTGTGQTTPVDTANAQTGIPELPSYSPAPPPVPANAPTAGLPGSTQSTVVSPIDMI